LCPHPQPAQITGLRDPRGDGATLYGAESSVGAGRRREGAAPGRWLEGEVYSAPARRRNRMPVSQQHPMKKARQGGRRVYPESRLASEIRKSDKNLPELAVFSGIWRAKL